VEAQEVITSAHLSSGLLYVSSFALSFGDEKGAWLCGHDQYFILDLASPYLPTFKSNPNVEGVIDFKEANASTTQVEY